MNVTVRCYDSPVEHTQDSIDPHSIDGVRLRHPADIGQAIRAERVAQGITQAELASEAGVSRRWLSATEKGHPTAELGLVLAVIRRLDFDLAAARRPRPVFDADAALRSLVDPPPTTCSDGGTS